jgi:hypothetical protein
MAKKSVVSNMAQALRCVSKLKQGKACTMAELKATAMLLESGYRTVVRNKKAVEKNMAFMERQMDLLSRFRQ